MKRKNTHTRTRTAAPPAQPVINRPVLTPRQEQALLLDRHLSVTANAGSGKTAVLVERYLRILLQREATVEEIVVLTYTDKAAGELRRRIAAALQDASQNAKAESVELLASIREQLPNAFIGTIHSFCARILHEYAFEAGVDANFGVLEGIDQRMVVAGAAGETLGAILQNEAVESLRSELYALIRARGRNWVFRFVVALVEKRDQLGRLTGLRGLYSLEDRQVLQRWHDAILEQLTADLSDPVLEADLESVCRVAPGALADFRRARNPEERAAAFLRLTEGMFRKDGKLAASFAGSGAAARELATEASRLRRRQMAMAPLLDLLLRPAHARRSHAALLSATRALITVARMTIERYDHQKLAASLLDYEDLQLRTRSLLANENVRRALAQRFRYIMVDEFQDTNFLQYELLLPLLTGLRTGNLFIVGDPGQSIYGFRDANPAVFEATRKDILESENGGAVVMDESFRPLADIAAFLSLVFSNRGAGTEFPPLVLARPNDSPGRIELLLHEPVAGEISEAEMIAHRIVRMLNGREPVFDRQERPRPVEPGDIAILIRNRTFLPDLENALTGHSIPYVVTGGIGFFQSQDLLDFYDYLRFLLNPSDSVALGGILRSPFFHVSDAELFEIALQRGQRDFWEFISSPEFQSEKFPHTARAAAILQEDLIKGLGLPPAELIEWIVRQTSYVPLLAGDTRGKQRLANLGKLRQFARAETGQGFVTLYDFVERLKVLVDREEHEGQEEVDSPGNAVRVMTVHAAKGLEFPVVILPRLHKRFQFDAEPYIDQRSGIGFSLPVEEGTEELSPLAAFMKERSRRKTIDEERRILYVACTRARDMLVLSGDREADRDKVQSLNWILQGVGIDDRPLSEVIERSVEIEQLKSMNGIWSRRMMQHNLKVHLLLPHDLSGEDPLVLQASEGRLFRPRLRIDPLPGETSFEEFRGEMLRLYVECPHGYFTRYQLGFPPSVEEEKAQRFEAAVSAHLRQGDAEPLLRLVPSARLGAIFHNFSPQLLLDLAMPVSQGILSNTLPLVYQDGGGVWNFVRFRQDSGPPGAEELMEESFRFLLGFDALLLQRSHEAPVVKGEFIIANEPGRSFSIEATSAVTEQYEVKIAEILRSIKQGHFEHRAFPCPICRAYGR